jgi:hypothetical protein
MIRHTPEPAREGIAEDFTDTVEDVPEAPAVIDTAGMSPAAAQAQRESYLKKGEALIHSLL